MSDQILIKAKIQALTDQGKKFYGTEPKDNPLYDYHVEAAIAAGFPNTQEGVLAYFNKNDAGRFLYTLDEPLYYDGYFKGKLQYTKKPWEDWHFKAARDNGYPETNQGLCDFYSKFDPWSYKPSPVLNNKKENTMTQTKQKIDPSVEFIKTIKLIREFVADNFTVGASLYDTKVFAETLKDEAKKEAGKTAKEREFSLMVRKVLLATPLSFRPHVFYTLKNNEENPRGFGGNLLGVDVNHLTDEDLNKPF